MTTTMFEAILESQFAKCREVLIEKAKQYAGDGDRLHNFRCAAGMQCCTATEALAGMMAKHTISIYDMCRDGKRHSEEMWDEKITDHINYLLLLRALVTEDTLHNDEDDMDFNTTASSTVPSMSLDRPFMTEWNLFNSPENLRPGVTQEMLDKIKEDLRNSED